MSRKRSKGVKVLLHSVHLIRKAEAVLVCHAIISIVLDVIFIVLGLVC